VKLELHPEGVIAANALDLFAAYDVIVDGTDNFPVRYLNNDAAVLTRKPLVYGSILQFEGQASVFAPHLGGPCYRCLFPKMPAAGEVPNCAEAGVFGALCGLIGGMQVMETLKLLLGTGEPLLGRLLVCDTLGATFRTLRLKRDPACPVCGDHPSILSLDPARYVFSCAVPAPANLSSPATSTMSQETPEEIDVHAAQALLSGPHPPFLLDVRESWENQTASIPGAVLIPLGELAARTAELPKDRALLVHCHHGGRSMRATQFLRAKGFARTTNLAGGIHQWSLQIDPSVPRY
jgi:adenylyltransferase/sulfurtransferase